MRRLLIVLALFPGPVWAQAVMRFDPTGSYYDFAYSVHVPAGSWLQRGWAFSTDPTIGAYLPDQIKCKGSMVLGSGGTHFEKVPEGSEPNPFPLENCQWDTFVGVGAGDANTVGTFNTFLGSQAGYANTNGDQNTFLGAHAGRLNTTGYHNTIIGVGAGKTQTSAYYNVIIGTDSGDVITTGYENVIVGTGSGGKQTTGNGNTFIGTTNGYNVTTGQLNTVLGYAANSGANTSRSIHIGAYAGFYETGSNKLLISSTTPTSEAEQRANAIIYGVMGANAAAQSLTINALHVNLSALAAYANNAAALAGGLVAGDLYIVAGADPRTIAIVF